jgi:uncharacterized protein YndB with AHSA1/START domain
MCDATSASDLVDDREFAAPPELLFEVWTRAEHFVHRFSPHGATVQFCEIDARPGGVIRFRHEFATGELISIKGVFDQVVAPSLLRFTFTFVDANDRPTVPPQVPDWPVGVHVVMTVELHPNSRGTRMIVRQRVSPADAATLPAVKRHHDMADDGWRETVERLIAYLRTSGC